MAIHYGPPSFKAYYRRGYALARLDMWDKAVLGQFLAPSLVGSLLIFGCRFRTSSRSRAEGCLLAGATATGKEEEVVVLVL